MDERVVSMRWDHTAPNRYGGNFARQALRSFVFDSSTAGSFYAEGQSPSRNLPVCMAQK